jgi:hypothetical protein
MSSHCLQLHWEDLDSTYPLTAIGVKSMMLGKIDHLIFREAQG